MPFLTSLVAAQQYNRPVPAGVRPYEFQNSGFSGNGYFLLTATRPGVPPNDPAFESPYPLMLDSDGYLTWYWKPDVAGCADFKYYPEADVYSVSMGTGGGTPRFYLLNSSLDLIDTLDGWNVWGDIHDVQHAANGNWLIATTPYDSMDLSAYTFDGMQGSANTVVHGFGVQEFDAAGNLVFEWSSNDHIFPTETYDFYGYNPNNFDYCHGNAIEEDTDGNLLLSFRHLNAIYKIDRMTGNVIWRLGGNSSDFTFVNDAGFSGQHDVRRLPGGQISLFDNSNMGAAPRKSRGVEYVLDTINWTATMVNEYIHPDQGYHMAMGSYRQLTDGSSLLGWGFSYRPDPTFTLVDAGQSIVAELFFDDSLMTYRAQYMEIPSLVRPEISCSEAGGQLILTAPAAASYEWSTGENTQSIVVSSADSYQVWVPFGEGVVGSAPYIVSDPSNGCSLALDELVKSANDTWEWFDLTGRRINWPVEGRLYLKVWPDGRVERTLYTTH